MYYKYCKGTSVRVRTTNGGEMVAKLLENYRPTYDVVIEVINGYVIVPAWRIKSIEAV
jgi:hypothetical protein